MRNLLRRLSTWYKLRKGRCSWCSEVLRDDARSTFCSDGCGMAEQEAAAI